MIIHNFDPVLVDLGFFQIKWYSVAYIMGIILGWSYALKIIKKTQNNTRYIEPIKRSDFDDLLFYLVLGIILGGRLGYVVFYNLDYYIHNFFQIFKLWQGGMSFHGGLFGVIVGIFIFSKNKNTNFFKYSDIVSCVAPIGIFLGRIANFINGELFGKVSTLPWSVIFPNGGNIARHPSQIYEAILEGLVLFILINFLALKKQLIIKTGYISSFFLIMYSILRMFSENFREPDQHLGYFFNYFSMGTLLSVVTLISGFLIILLLKKNEQNN
jgi:phosphatidylglycerol---prolipoprotein diacylglyceryl transferase